MTGFLNKGSYIGYKNLPKHFDKSVALSGVSLLKQNGLAKSSRSTADKALRPEDTVL